MFTSFDKAIVAIIMGVIYLINSTFGLNIGVSADTVNALVVAISPLLIWLVPNKATT